MIVFFKKGGFLVLMASILYSIRGVVHKLRPMQNRAGPEMSSKHLWAKMRIAAARHPKLRQRMQDVWNLWCLHAFPFIDRY